ncbi:SMP-30/gluconolactonase/LRE family protein [Hydrogenophaga sp. BPS33]|uniref:SMP-30/gluconolactonase/LRE family protein n=1 Tax=Hydrogenophaga sp. BPS33 TaxID=2651974 RepID=UPI001320089C|nr:SMP-30/gluconolactonase/LRE family protein [Hydrogenophaga sp. BPS33]QHE83596.1 SMP-30/gluconolactonase/LRE family protein [Hydrogenophaga sp. BPS33]
MTAPAPNPLDGFVVDRAAIRYAGRDLQRPECILAERDGTLWAADARGGVTRIAADGTQRFVGQRADTAFASVDAATAEAFETKFTQGTLPNGLAFNAEGEILISNFGTDCLEVMARDGRTRTLVDRIDGMPIGKVNFVLRDRRNRIWLTVSTRVNPWTAAAARRVKDGYIAVIDEHGLRVVAEGFHFTNEVRLDAREEWLYIVETTGPHITRMRLDESAAAGVRLTDREVFGPSHLGGPPDGIAFDSFGNLWCTLVMVDQLIALTPQGDKRLLLDDSNGEPARALVQRMQDGTASAEDMQRAHGSIAPWMASITFGGPDLRTVYLGSLLGTRIPYFQSPVAGLPMVHWDAAR